MPMDTAEKSHDKSDVIVYFKDKNGCTIRLIKSLDGVTYPVVFKRPMAVIFDSLPDMNSRKDDLLVATYPKSGSTWIYAICYMLMNRTTQIPYNTRFIECLDAEEYSRLESPRVVISHLKFKFFPNDLINTGGKIINLIRNPKDTAVSSYHFALKMKTLKYGGTWDGFLDLFMKGNTIFGSWFDYIKGWDSIARKYPDNVLQIHYEQLNKNTKNTLRLIADFLEVNESDHLLNQIEIVTSFDNMKKIDKDKDVEFWEENSTTGKNPIFRKGKVGDWKNVFTVKQNEEFDQLFAEKMIGSNCTFEYE